MSVYRVMTMCATTCHGLQSQQRGYKPSKPSLRHVDLVGRAARQPVQHSVLARRSSVLCIAAHDCVSRAAGNPTNIIVGQAIDLSFLDFSKWTLLPTLCALLLPIRTATSECMLHVL